MLGLFTIFDGYILGSRWRMARAKKSVQSDPNIDQVVKQFEKSSAALQLVDLHFSKPPGCATGADLQFLIRHDTFSLLL